MPARILVVEDEPDVAELVAFHLQRRGHHPEVVHDAASAWRRLQDSHVDLVVLDLMLPGDVDGVELCRRIRRAPHTASLPVVMVTARGEEVDRVVGFEVGADDYVPKPFSPRELVLRIEAVLRRSHMGAHGTRPENDVLRFGPLCIDLPGHRVEVDGAPVELTALEFRLLAWLAERPGRVQSREQLLEHVWGYAPGVGSRTVDTHVRRLRGKLGSAAELIETVRGVGYRLRAPRE